MEMKPCPFCGNKNIEVEYHYSLRVYDVRCFRVKCNVNPCTHDYKTSKGAANAWNKRHED